MEHVVVGTVNQGVLTDRLHAYKIIEEVEGITHKHRSSSTTTNTTLGAPSSSGWSWFGWTSSPENGHSKTDSHGSSDNANIDIIQPRMQMKGEDNHNQPLTFHVNHHERNRYIRKQDIDEFIHALLHPEMYSKFIEVSNTERDIANSEFNESKQCEKYLGRGVGMMKLLTSFEYHNQDFIGEIDNDDDDDDDILEAQVFNLDATTQIPLPYACCYFRNSDMVMASVHESRHPSGKNTNKITTTTSSIGEKCDMISLLDIYCEKEVVLSSMELAFFDAQESLAQLLWNNASQSSNFMRYGVYFSI